MPGRLRCPAPELLDEVGMQRDLVVSENGLRNAVILAERIAETPPRQLHAGRNRYHYTHKRFLMCLF